MHIYILYIIIYIYIYISHVYIYISFIYIYIYQIYHIILNHIKSYHIHVYIIVNIILFIGLPPWYTAFRHHKKLPVLPRQKTRFPNKNRGLPIRNHPSPKKLSVPSMNCKASSQLSASLKATL